MKEEDREGGAVPLTQQGEGPVLLSCDVVRPGKDGGTSGS